jgi:FdhD protein
MATNNIKHHRINLKKNESHLMDDIVAKDIPFCLFLEMIPYITVMLTPTMLKEFVIGHLFTEGIIDDLDEIEEIEISQRKAYAFLNKKLDLDKLRSRKNAILTTACGAPSEISTVSIKKVKSNLSRLVDPDHIWYLTYRLNKMSNLFRKTGCTHSALLYEQKNNAFAFAEDVGRHNALDKVLGFAFINGVDLGDCILVASGRLSADMVLKAVHSGVPIVTSIAGPLNSGINVAEASGITLVGFIRGRRMNVYTHSKKISFS